MVNFRLALCVDLLRKSHVHVVMMSVREKDILIFFLWTTNLQGHSAKMSIYSRFLNAKYFDCGVFPARQ